MRITCHGVVAKDNPDALYLTGRNELFRYAPLIIILGGLTGCGGSDDGDLTETHALRLQATAWENRMPSGLMPGQAAACTPLIVAFSIRAGSKGFPAGVQAKSVSLSKQGVAAWESPVSSTETGLGIRWVSDDDWISLVGSADENPPPGTKSEQVLSGVARACATEKLREGDSLVVKVALEAGDEAAIVQSDVKLFAAY